MFILDLELRKFLANESLDFLEDLNVILGDQSHCLTGLASPSRASHSVNVILRVGWDVKVDDNID